MNLMIKKVGESFLGFALTKVESFLLLDYPEITC